MIFSLLVSFHAFFLMVYFKFVFHPITTKLDIQIYLVYKIFEPPQSGPLMKCTVAHLTGNNISYKKSSFKKPSKKVKYIGD